MFHIKYYANKIGKTIFKVKQNIYLYYIRYNIYKANSVQDLISILKSIASNNKGITSDELFTILTDCFIKYPLTEIELQKMSTWEQLYNTDLGLDNYATTIIWLCTIQAIQENEQKLLTYNSTSYPHPK